MWTCSDELPEGIDIVFTHSTKSEPDPTPRQGIDFDSPHNPNHVLRLRLAEVSTGQREEPYVLGLHAYSPVWTDSSSEPMPTEIFVAAYDNIQSPKEKSLLSYRIQLSRTELGGSMKLKPISAVENDKWRLSLVNKTRAPAARLPWNARSMSNAGTMFSMQERLYCYTLFSEQEQPTNMLPLPTSATVTVEPTSGNIACATSDGVVKIFQLR